MWGQAGRDPGKIADYLTGRGLPPEAPEALRFHPSLPYYNEGYVGSFPALLARLQAPDGEVVSLLRIYLDPKGTAKLNLGDDYPAKKLVSVGAQGTIKGSAIRLDEAGSVIGLGEGVETMLAVRAATGQRCWACGSAVALESVVLAPDVATVHIWADNDFSGRGQAAANKAACRLQAEGRLIFVHTPECPGTDWLDIYANDGPEKLLAAEAEDPPWSPVEEHRNGLGCDGWESPIPLDCHAQLPVFPVRALPEAGRAFALEIAQGRQVPVDMPGIAILGVLAAAAAGRFELELPTHTEPLNLYLLPAFPPGTRKSQVVRDVVAPLCEVEREMVETAKGPMAEERAKREIAETRVRYLRDRAAKVQDPAERDEMRSEMARLLASLEEPPSSPRLICDDITPERLASLLSENNGVMAIVSAEGGIIGMMAGRYQERGGPNLDVYLKGHSGDQLRVDRASDSSTGQTRIVPRPALTLLLMVQPEILSDLCRIQGARGRGLLGRFLYALPACNLGTRLYGERPVDGACRLRYHGIVRQALSHPVLEAPRLLHLTPQAFELWREFHDQVERRLAEGEDLHDLADWASKAAGAVARIAGALHVAENAQGRPDNLSVPPETMQAAIEIGHYFVAHAKSAFALMVDPPDVRLARRILGWIERKEPGEFSLRDCHQAIRVARPADLHPGFAVLEEHGYLRPLAPPSRKGPGRPSGTRWAVNPCACNPSQNARNGGSGVDSVHFVSDPQRVQGAPDSPALLLSQG